MFLASPDALPPRPTPSPQQPCAIAPMATDADAITGACQPIADASPVVESTPASESIPVSDSHPVIPLAASIAPPDHQHTPTPLSVSQRPILKRGSRGDSVLRLQTQLQQQGYEPGSLDGIYGRRTQEAVQAFQQDQDLSVDGIVGRETWGALQRVTATPQPDPIQAKPSSPESISLSPKPRPSTSATPTEEPLHPDIAEPEPVRFTWVWIAGWIVLYGSGWVWIIYDARRPLKLTPSSASPKHPKQPKTVAETPETAEPLPKATAAVETAPIQMAETDGIEMTAVETTPIETFETDDVETDDVDKAAVAGSINTLSPTTPPTEAAIAHPQSLTPQPITTSTSQPSSVPVSGTPADTQSPAPLAEADTLSPSTAHQPAPEEETPDIPYVDPTELAPFAQLFNDWSSTDDSVYEDETVIARLPDPATDLEEPTFHYSLVDWAEDLFVLRGNELRVLKSRLTRYGNRINKIITIRRTDNTGAYEDKSFHLTLG